jgi:phosphate acetyltransferase
VLELLTAHEAVTAAADCAGVSYDEVHADPVAALDRIVERYHRLAATVDAVVVVGSDYTDVGTPTEFAYNARVATNLGTPVLLVVNGAGRSPGELRAVTDMALAELRAQHGTLAAVVANRVEPSGLAGAVAALAALGVPAFAIPEEPLLSAPSVAELAAAVDASLVAGDETSLDREVRGLVVATTTLPPLLDRLAEGAVVVTAGDRPDVVLGVLLAGTSAGFPHAAALVLEGGLPLPEQLARLLTDAAATTPVLATDLDAQATAAALSALRGRVSTRTPRKVATALALFAEHVDGDLLLDRLEVARSDVVTPLMFEHRVLDAAAADRRRIVLPEGEEDRVLLAADIVLRRRIANLTLLGDPQRIAARASMLGIDLTGAMLLSPRDEPLVERFARAYLERRRDRGTGPDGDLEEARATVTDATYFGTMMVLLGLADGMVSGAAHTTAHTIRPALQVLGARPGADVVSSVFFMCLPHQVLVYGDCAVVPDPTADQLADIAIASAQTAAAFGVEPRVAMLSYSTGASGSGQDVEKVARATTLVRTRAPGLAVEGPIQYDAAIDAAVAHTKLPGSQVAGRATVFVFPDLNTGNNTYKAVQRSAGAVAVGPVLQGLRRPVNDLSRGASVREIVTTVAITAVQAQQLAQQLAGEAARPEWAEPR